jgi:hypothetical protein
MLGRDTTLSQATPDHAFRSRARSTATLQWLWRRAKPGDVLALLVHPGTGPSDPEGVEAVTPPLYGVRPWLGGTWVTLGPPGSESALPAEAERGAGRPCLPGSEVRFDWSIVDEEHSISDQVEALRGGRTDGEVAVSTSSSHEFLVDLVARNRGETRESVLREAIALLLDSGDVDPVTGGGLR